MDDDEELELFVENGDRYTFDVRNNDVRCNGHPMKDSEALQLLAYWIVEAKTEPWDR